MLSDPELPVRLRRLQVDIAADLRALEARAAEVRALMERRWAREGTLPRPELVLVAVNLHGWYTAAETAYERVARLLDQSVPEGATWHVELVAQMRIEVPGLRPAVLPAVAADHLDELRKFRRFFRNAYVLELDPARVLERATDLIRATPAVEGGLAALGAYLGDVLSRM